jgi:hypothetical protein
VHGYGKGLGSWEKTGYVWSNDDVLVIQNCTK